MAPIIMGVPWLQQIPLHVNDHTRRLRMDPTALSVVPFGDSRASTPREPYVDHLIGDEYLSTTIDKIPLAEREVLRWDFLVV
jgi:hypothetical protein